MKKTIQIILGLVVGIFLLWLMFRGTDWGEVLHAVRQANPFWILISAAFVLISCITRVKRWSYVVRTAGPVSFRHMLSATQIGFLANFTLPLRAGEAIRALVLNRLTAIPFTRCFAFVALDRVLDLFGLLAVMIGAALVFKPETIALPPEIPVPEWAEGYLNPEMIRVGAMSSATLLIAIIGIFVLLYLNQRLALRISDGIFNMISEKLATRIHGLVQHFADGLHIFRSPGDMAKAIAWSLFTWCMFAGSYLSCMSAFSLDYPWYTAFVVLSVVAVTMSVPGAPGFIGQFHFGIILGVYLILPDVEPGRVKALAIVAHLLNLIPISLFGLVCLYMENMDLIELQRESEAAESELETTAGTDSGAPGN